VLFEIHCPVLAIFGEKDAHVDCRKTVALYRKTMLSAVIADLVIRTLLDDNHGIQQDANGGVREAGTLWAEGKHCEGYYDMMIKWLRERGFSNG